jgi:hypothetical protein
MAELDMLVTTLATELCDAYRADEQITGIDISAGLYGTCTNEWIRDVANTIMILQNRIKELEDEVSKPNTLH